MKLIELIKNRYNKQWDWFYLSQNHNITEQDILTNHTLPWSFYSILQNPSLSLSQLNNIYSKLWGTRLDNVLQSAIPGTNKCASWYLSRNTKVPIHWFLNYEAQGLIETDIDWYSIAKHPQLTMADLEHDTINKANIIFEAQQNTSLPLDMLIDWLTSNNYSTYTISYRNDITEQDIDRYPNFNWNYSCLSSVLKPDYIERHREKEWCETLFLLNPTFEVEDMIKHCSASCLQNTGSLISLNPSITLNKVREWRETHHFEWSDMLLSGNPGITIEDIYYNPVYEWCYSMVSKNTFSQQEVDYMRNSSKHRMQQTNQYISRLKPELLSYTWHPQRFQEWCLDEEDRERIQHYTTDYTVIV